MLGRAERQPHSFDELLVRSETGLGAEGGPQPRPRRRAREEAPVREPVRT
jgi:hypothetical protein